MIGKSGERVSGISVLPARHDDIDDDDSYNNNLFSPWHMVSSNLILIEKSPIDVKDNFVAYAIV